MIFEPALQVGDRDDHVHGAFPTLPVDVNADSMLRVKHIAHAKILEFPATETSLELHGNQGFVARVLGRLDQRDNLLPPQEVPFGWDRIEVVARPGRNPVEALGGFASLHPVPTEHRRAVR